MHLLDSYYSCKKKQRRFVTLPRILQGCHTPGRHQLGYLYSKKYASLSCTMHYELRNSMGAWILESRKPGHTFGIRNKHRHKAGSPVGDLDGEISLLVLELVDPNRLPRRISPKCQCKAQQQSNGEWANSSHCVTMLAQSSVERRTLQDERRNRCIYADG